MARSIIQAVIITAVILIIITFIPGKLFCYGSAILALFAIILAIVDTSKERTAK